MGFWTHSVCHWSLYNFIYGDRYCKWIHPSNSFYKWLVLLSVLGVFYFSDNWKSDEYSAVAKRHFELCALSHMTAIQALAERCSFDRDSKRTSLKLWKSLKWLTNAKSDCIRWNRFERARRSMLMLMLMWYEAHSIQYHSTFDRNSRTMVFGIFLCHMSIPCTSLKTISNR